MAKTIAELSGFCDLMNGRIAVTHESVTDLWKQNEKLADQLRVCELEAIGHREALAHARKQLEQGWDKLDEQQRVDAELRQEIALLKQRLDDHLKRVELWDTRRWGLIVSVALAVFGVAASFTSGLVLATLRK